MSEGNALAHQKLRKKGRSMLVLGTPAFPLFPKMRDDSYGFFEWVGELPRQLANPLKKRLRAAGAQLAR